MHSQLHMAIQDPGPQSTDRVFKYGDDFLQTLQTLQDNRSWFSCQELFRSVDACCHPDSNSPSSSSRLDIHGCISYVHSPNEFAT